MKVRMKFSKTGSMKFVGHLDVMRYFQKAIKRANVDIMYSQGYNPHQLMSFAAPLGVGLTSDAEYVDLFLGDCDSSSEMMKRLNEVMVEGFEVRSFLKIEDETKNAMSSVAAADYLISLKDGYTLCDRENFVFQEQFDQFYQQDTIETMKKSKKSERMVDIKPLIYAMEYPTEELYAKSTAQKFENGVAVILKVSTGSVDNLKPELVMEAFCNYLQVEFNPFAWQIHRLEVYESLIPLDETKQVKLDQLVPLDYDRKLL